MKNFKDFGIKIDDLNQFSGEKIKMFNILNRAIIIHHYRIVESKFHGERLDIQLELNNEKRVLWTSSKSLMRILKQIPEDGFPFEVTIVQKEDKRYILT